MTTKVDGKNDNSLAEQGKVQNSTASKQVPMTTNVDGKNDETTAKHEDLKRERDLLLETARLAPDDAKADARKALVAFDHSHPKFAREIYDCATLSRKGLLVKVFSEGWKLYWPPFCEQAIEHEKSLAGVDPSPTIAALAEQAATEYLWLSALRSMVGNATATTPAEFLGMLPTLSKEVDRVHRRYLQTLRMLAVVRRLEKGLELHVVHHDANAAESQPQGGRVRRLPDDEIVEAEVVDVRPPHPIPALK